MATFDRENSSKNFLLNDQKAILCRESAIGENSGVWDPILLGANLLVPAKVIKTIEACCSLVEVISGQVPMKSPKGQWSHGVKCAYQKAAGGLHIFYLKIWNKAAVTSKLGFGQ